MSQCRHCHPAPAAPQPVRVAEIIIAKELDDTGSNIYYSCLDEAGEELSLLNTLGLLEFTKASLVADHLYATGDEDQSDADV